jgi:hypothetical protein
MEIEKKILDFIQSKKKKLEIAGLRGLVKTGENEWSFRFTYRDEDSLSMSDLYKVKISGIKNTPSFVTDKKVVKTKLKTVLKK